MTNRTHPAWINSSIVVATSLSALLFTLRGVAQPSTQSTAPSASISTQSSENGPTTSASATPSASISGHLSSNSAVNPVSHPSGADSPSSAVLLTADIVADRALKTSRQSKVDEAKIAVARAQMDQAWNNFLPRLSLVARYTRLSPIDPPNLFPDTPYRSVVVNQPTAGPIAPGTPLFASPPTSFSFPVLLNNYTFQATLQVPFSDYLLRINQNYKSAISAETAAKMQAKVSLLQSTYDARNAYYTWLRAKEQLNVAKSAVNVAKAHLKDLQNLFAVKATTTADVFRVEAMVAASEAMVTKAENFVVIAEANMRMLMHAPDAENYAPKETIDAELGKLSRELPLLVRESVAKRPEFKALDAQIESLERKLDVITASYYPRLDGVANLTIANPNQRLVPAQDKFYTTWDLSLQLSWSPNDWLQARGQKAELVAQIANIRAAKEQLQDGLRMEVVSAYTKVREAESTLQSTAVQRRAAEEAYRVRLEQFKNGTATSSMLIDAESDVTRAKLDEVNARVDLRIAHAALKKATGE